jgi:arylsulfatase A-like enzyme
VRAKITGIHLIAALVALAIASWATHAWAQNQSDRTASGNNVQKKAQERVSDKLPDVDRLSRRGVIFTDWYSRQSCTSGWAAFETGRYPARAGLGKIGQTETE